MSELSRCDLLPLQNGHSLLFGLNDLCDPGRGTVCGVACFTADALCQQGHRRTVAVRERARLSQASLTLGEAATCSVPRVLKRIFGFAGTVHLAL